MEIYFFRSKCVKLEVRAVCRSKGILPLQLNKMEESMMCNDEGNDKHRTRFLS